MSPAHFIALFFCIILFLCMGIFTQVVVYILSCILDKKGDTDTTWSIFRIAGYITFAFFVVSLLSGIASLI